MSRKNTKKKKFQKTIALNRIQKLFLLAEKKAFLGDFNLANRYIQIARELSMRYLVSIPIEFKRRFCKHCYHYLQTGKNCRIRIHRGRLIIYCNNCKKFTRIPLKDKGFTFR